MELADVAFSFRHSPRLKGSCGGNVLSLPSVLFSTEEEKLQLSPQQHCLRVPLWPAAAEPQVERPALDPG